MRISEWEAQNRNQGKYESPSNQALHHLLMTQNRTYQETLKKSARILRDKVDEEFEVLKTMSAMGGGAGMDELSKNLNPFKRKQNAPVAYWSGIIDTGREKRTVKYHVPDYFNGTIRVLAVAVSKERLGVASSSAIARNTFVISPSARV